MFNDKEVPGGVYAIDGIPIAPKSYATSGEPDDILDHDWAKTAFVLPDDGFTEGVDLQNRYWSSASGKFTDGRFGCNIGVNCHPQFTPYCDIPDPGRLAGRQNVTLLETSGNYGMGGFWSTAFDDPEQIIYMRFGVPEFNSLFSFFSRAFNHGSSVLARTGRWPSFLYDVSSFLGSALMLTAFPLIAVPILIYEVADYFLFRQSARFYHMKPTMHLYWSSVNMLVNTLALNSGIYPKLLDANSDDTQRIGMPMKLDQDTMDIYHELAPDIFTKENYIDVFALANRAQRIANQLLSDEYNSLNQGTSTDFYGKLKREMTGDGTRSSKVSDKDGNLTFAAMVNKFVLFGEYYDAPKEEVQQESDIRTGRDEKSYDPLYSDSSWNNFKKHLSSEFRMGGQFAVMRVSATGAQSESFSNNVQSSSLESKLNSTSSTFAEHRFTFGNGAGLGAVAETVLGAATDVMMGALSGATFGIADGIKGLMGDGYVDIPKHWQSSSAQLPQGRYKIVCTAPYANVITRIMRLFVPFAMIAAGAWPRSTGRQSYTAPFLCQLYDAGRVQIPLGMITEFTVLRGSGNLGFNLKNQPLSLEISFTVTDLSSILHMPLTTGKLMGETTMIDEESTITNYLATVAGQSVYNQVYPVSKAKIRAAKVALNAGMLSSPAFWGSVVHDQATEGIFKYLAVGPMIEAAARGAEVTVGNDSL